MCWELLQEHCIYDITAYKSSDLCNRRAQREVSAFCPSNGVTKAGVTKSGSQFGAAEPGKGVCCGREGHLRREIPGSEAPLGKSHHPSLPAPPEALNCVWLSSYFLSEVFLEECLPPFRFF